MRSITSITAEETCVGAVASMRNPYASYALVITEIERYAHGGIKEVVATHADTIAGKLVAREGSRHSDYRFRMNRRGELVAVDKSSGRIQSEWYASRLVLNSDYTQPYMD